MADMPTVEVKIEITENQLLDETWYTAAVEVDGDWIGTEEVYYTKAEAIAECVATIGTTLLDREGYRGSMIAAVR